MGPCRTRLPRAPRILIQYTRITFSHLVWWRHFITENRAGLVLAVSDPRPDIESVQPTEKDGVGDLEIVAKIGVRRISAVSLAPDLDRGIDQFGTLVDTTHIVRYGAGPDGLGKGEPAAAPTATMELC